MKAPADTTYSEGGTGNLDQLPRTAPPRNMMNTSEFLQCICIRAETRGESAMKISERMTRDVEIAAPTQSIREAARLMADMDVGALPVGENDRLVGMITDRDIVVRALASGRGPDTPIRDVMSPEIKYCYEDETVEDVARNMGNVQVRRLPVLNREKRLVGIVSLGDVATSDPQKTRSGEALSEISQRGGEHSQSQTEQAGSKAKRSATAKKTAKDKSSHH